MFGTFLDMRLPDGGRKFLTRCVECFALFIYDNIFLLNIRLFNRFINIILSFLRQEFLFYLIIFRSFEK